MKRILVVDDSSTILKFVEDVLKTKYEPILVKSGELALSYLEENAVDMVLLDIFMPKMDGFETFQKMKEMEQAQDIPVVFFTSGVEAEKSGLQTTKKQSGISGSFRRRSPLPSAMAVPPRTQKGTSLPTRPPNSARAATDKGYS